VVCLVTRIRVVNNNSSNHNNKIIFNLIYKINNNKISRPIPNNNNNLHLTLQIIKIRIKMHKASQSVVVDCFSRINNLNNNSNNN